MTLHNLGQTSRLEEWAEKLRLESAEDLLTAARRSTAIVPANITFYPMRVGDNLLRKGAELLNRGLSRRLSEELMIEGNILFKHTDMDVRLGDVIYPREYLRWLDRKLLNSILPRLDSLETAFNLRTAKGVWAAKPLSRSIRHNVQSIRDEYMHRMYANVTVNLCHLASRIILLLLVRGRTEITEQEFHRVLYLAVRKVQTQSSVQLHRSLRNPEAYSGLLDGDCLGLSQFIKTASSSQLVERADGVYRFLPKLREKHKLDEIRIENLVAVYANEVAPLPQVCRAIEEAISEAPQLSPKEFERHRFDDERIAIHWDRLQFSKPRHRAINEQETATSDPEPFLFQPDRPNEIGVVLVHGFLASPAQVKGFGERLMRGGYTVLGLRLKGHGTSPWDLRERSWEDWFASLTRGFEAMATLTKRVYLVGFSTGGALALRLAANQPERLAGVAAVSVPLKFQNKNMVFVPIMHSANQLVRWMSAYEGIMPFRPNDSEQPDTNYRHMPIRGLYELRRMMDDLQNHLKAVRCPVLLLQGSGDPVVSPNSARLLYDSLEQASSTLKVIEAQRHGILSEDIGGTQQIIMDFFAGKAIEEEPVLTEPLIGLQQV